LPDEFASFAVPSCDLSVNGLHDCLLMLPETLSLPPTKLRFMNEDDVAFMHIADENVRFLERFGFQPNSTILDIGSGYGRLAYGILNRLEFRGHYVGLDILPMHVRWCRENISAQFPQFRFELIDVRNDRYNPLGTAPAEGFRFELADASFDFCALFSVFTHMYEEEIRRYLAEVQRLLRAKGVVVATFFLLEANRVARLETRTSGLTMRHVLNKHTRCHNPTDRLHAIAFDRDWVQRTIEDMGFDILQISEGNWAGDPVAYYQDCVVFRKAGRLDNG
jgi:SAM-dependent methyltransferase